MLSPSTHITFEFLGVLLGVYLLTQGLMYIKTKEKKLKTFAIFNIIFGIASIIIDSIFILSFR